MRILFTFILTVAFGATSLYAQQVTSLTGPNQVNKVKSAEKKAEAAPNKSENVMGSTATDSQYSKEKIQARQAAQQNTKDLNAEIERVEREIIEVKSHLGKQTTDPRYDASAAKIRLDQLKKELRELKVKTL